MEEQARTIPKHPELPEAMDFRLMKSAGIDEVQKLSGDIWTDYNEHDPGVTILEQLCYTLTELAYKTRFRIQDILYASPKTREEIEKYPFFKPHEIYPTNPLSALDYRAMIVDHMYPHVENAWLIPETKSTYGIDMSGAFAISLLLKRDAPVKRIRREVKALVNRNRNLCEDVQSVDVMQPLKVAISCELDINPNEKAELVAAQLLFSMMSELRPQVRFRSMEDLLEEGHSLEDIFDRPRPIHGFIEMEDLRRTTIDIFRKLPVSSQLIGDFRNIRGVEDVRNVEIGMSLGKEFVPEGLYLVKILDDDDKIQGWYITPDIEELAPGHFVVKEEDEIPQDLYTFLEGNLIPEGFYPSLDVDEVLRNDFLKFYANRVPLELDPNLVQKHLEMLKMQKVKGFEHPMEFREEFPQSPFRTKDIEAYFSLQHTFPRIYGIGPYGTPARSTDTRKAYAKQLKSYLFFYEILMASYLSQLAHFHKLLSLNDDLESTYFNQLPNFPNMHHILGDAEDQAQLLENLRKVLSDFDPKLRRKNRALDHLLARFGESFLSETHNALNRKAFVGNQEEYDTQLMKSKVTFLKDYLVLGKERGKGFNHASPVVVQDEGIPIYSENVATLKKRVSLLFNLSDFRRKRLCNTISENSELALYKGKRTTKAGYKKGGGGTFLFRAKGINMLSEVMMRGLSRDNYKVRKEGDQKYGVFFRVSTAGRVGQKVKEQELKVFGGPSVEACEESISLLIKRLKDLNNRGEGFHLLEHLLLRPLGPPGYFCYLVDEGRILVESDLNSITHFAEYFSGLLQEYGTDPKNYKVSRSEQGRFRISLKGASGKRLAHFDGLDSKEAGEDKIPEIVAAIKELSDTESPAEVIEAETPFLIYRGAEGGSQTVLLRSSEQGRNIFQKIFRDLLSEYGKTAKNYKITGSTEMGYKVELFDTSGNLIAYRGGFVLKESASSNKDEIIAAIKNLGKKEGGPRFILQEYIPKGAMLEEDFFSNRISIVLPSWPARFQNDKFKALFEQVIKMNSPAHTMIKCYWADYAELKDFETVYFKWLEAKSTNNQPELDELSYNLILLLKYFENPMDEMVVDQMDELKENIRWL